MSTAELATATAARAQAAKRPAEESRLAAWQSYCQLLFCLNEFLYLD